MRRGIFWAAVVMATVRSASAQQIIDRDTTLDQFTSIFAGPIWIVDGPTGPSTVEMVDGADIGATITVRDHSVLNIRGGSSGSFVMALDHATLNIFGGTPARGEDVLAGGNGTVNIWGGVMDDDVIVTESGVAHIYGGDLNRSTLGVQRDGVIHVYLREYSLLPPDGISPLNRVSGILSDGSAITATLWVDPSHLGSGHHEFHVVPEPQGLALGMFGMVLAGIVLRLPQPAGRVIQVGGDTPVRVVAFFTSSAEDRLGEQDSTFPAEG